MSKEDHAAAVEFVNDEMVRQELGVYELARKAGVDPATVSDFVAGRRWPQVATRKRVSEALGWLPEGIDRLARGQAPTDQTETVSDGDQDEGVLMSLPRGAFEGLSPSDREEAIAAAKATLLERAREIRRRLDS